MSRGPSCWSCTRTEASRRCSGRTAPRTKKSDGPGRRHLLTPRPAGIAEGMGHIVGRVPSLHRTHSVPASETSEFGINGTDQSLSNACTSDPEGKTGRFHRGCLRRATGFQEGNPPENTLQRVCCSNRCTETPAAPKYPLLRYNGASETG